MRLPAASFGVGMSGGTPRYGTGAGVGAPAPSYWDPAYGGIPNLPSPTASAGAAISGNLGNMADIYRLAAGANAFQNQQLQQGYIANMPNYLQHMAKNSQNITEGQAGMLPQDVVNQLIQRGAERGIATGAPGGPNANAAYMRALGLNSLDMQNKAFEQLMQTRATTPVAQPMDLASMMVTPQQYHDTASMQSIYNSAPIPRNAAMAAMEAARSGMWGGYGGGGGGFGGAYSPSPSLGGPPPARPDMSFKGWPMDQAYGPLRSLEPHTSNYSPFDNWYENAYGKPYSGQSATPGTMYGPSYDDWWYSDPGADYLMQPGGIEDWLLNY